jgi:hypothetical protein
MYSRYYVLREIDRAPPSQNKVFFKNNVKSPVCMQAESIRSRLLYFQFSKRFISDSSATPRCVHAIDTRPFIFFLFGFENQASWSVVQFIRSHDPFMAQDQ